MLRRVLSLWVRISWEWNCTTSILTYDFTASIRTEKVSFITVVHCEKISFGVKPPIWNGLVVVLSFTSYRLCGHHLRLIHLCNHALVASIKVFEVRLIAILNSLKLIAIMRWKFKLLDCMMRSGQHALRDANIGSVNHYWKLFLNAFTVDGTLICSC
jgi:hypothetical protein